MRSKCYFLLCFIASMYGSACTEQPSSTTNGPTEIVSDQEIEIAIKKRVDDHPFFQRKQWVTSDGTERLDRDDVMDVERPDAESAIEELRLNGADFLFDEDDNLTGIDLMHGNPTEPKQLIDAGLILLKYLPTL